jgi:hypothetical protein
MVSGSFIGAKIRKAGARNGLRVAGLQVSRFKSQIPNLKSQISNLKSQISNPKSQIPIFMIQVRLSARSFDPKPRAYDLLFGSFFGFVIWDLQLGILDLGQPTNDFPLYLSTAIQPTCLGYRLIVAITSFPGVVSVHRRTRAGTVFQI